MTSTPAPADPIADLTREEAATRAGVVHEVSYAVDLDLTASGEEFVSRTTVRFLATPGASTFLDLIAARVHRVTLNGAALPAEAVAAGRIALTDLGERNEVVVEADCRYVRTGQGLHRFVDPADGETYLYSQFAEMDARRVFACFDQPDIKASWQLGVLAPARWAVISNARSPEPEVIAGHGGSAAESSDAVARWSFDETPRMSTYVMAVVAGPYAYEETTLETLAGAVPARVWGRPALREHLAAAEVFEATQAGLRFYEAAMGVPFPYDSYDQVYVPEYNLGAMENVGCVTISEDSLLFRSRPSQAQEEFRTVVVLHELAHMWFGDLVTMRWWDDLWLNESFAEFAGTLTGERVTEHADAWVSFGVHRKSVAYRIDQLPTTHPVIGDVPSVEATTGAFDMITYAKGASVLRQLAHTLGEEVFFAGIGAYLRAYAEGNATLTELLAELERASGRDLGEWSTAWLATAGLSTLTAEISQEESGALAAIRVVESLPSGEGIPAPQPHRSHRLNVAGYALREGVLEREWVEDVSVTGGAGEVPNVAGRARPDLLMVNDDDLTYAKVVLDEVSLATVLQHPGAVAAPMLQSLVLTSLWHAVRDGRLDAEDYLPAALGILAVAGNSTTISATCGHLATAVAQYVTPARSAQVRASVADALWALVLASAEGSDAQLQLLRGYLAVMGTTAQGERAMALLAGTSPVGGVSVDVDLRWEILQGAVACGAASEADVAAALAADDTAAGRRRAAGVRAAVGTPEAKAAAWRS